MKQTLDVLGGALIVGLVGWGYAEPARALRRRDRLGLRSLAGSYWCHIRLIPRATAVTAAGAFRHPFRWDGPPFGSVLLIAVASFGAAAGAVYSVVGPNRGEALVWAPVLLVVAVGLGILLVRDTPGVQDHVQDGPPDDLDGAHFKGP